MAQKKKKKEGKPLKKKAIKKFAPHLRAKEVSNPIQEQMDQIQAQFAHLLKLAKVGPHELIRAERDLFDPHRANGAEPDFTADTGSWGLDQTGQPAMLGTVNDFVLNKETVMSMLGTLTAKIEVLSQRQLSLAQDILVIKSNQRPGVR